MIWLPFLEKNFLSIDFGSMNIKVVEGQRRKNNIEITNFGIIPIINFKEITATSYILEENLASIIKDFFKEAKIKTNNVFFNISAPYIFTASFLVPNIPEKNLPQVIRFESQKQIPLSLEEIEIEYRYLQIETETQTKQWLVFLAAVPKSYLRKLENISSIAKLKFAGYSLEYFNLEPYFWQKIGNFVVIDLGHSYSTLHLIREGKIIYGSKLKIRGYDYLDSIMNLTKFSEEETLNFVIKRGFMFNPEEKDFKYLANNFLDSLQKGIELEIEKLENNFLIKIDKIYWTGGVCLLNGFKEEISARISKYQQEILLPSDFVESEKFKILGEKSTIFSEAVGVLLKKLLS